MSDAAAGKPVAHPRTDDPSWPQKLVAIMTARQKAASERFLAKAAIEPGAVLLTPGLIYREVTPGTGPSPKPGELADVNGRLSFVNGAVIFEGPMRVPMDGRGIGEAVLTMKVGGTSIVVAGPVTEAHDQIPEGAALIYQIDLLRIEGR